MVVEMEGYWEISSLPSVWGGEKVILCDMLVHQNTSSNLAVPGRKGNNLFA